MKLTHRAAFVTLGNITALALALAFAATLTGGSPAHGHRTALGLTTQAPAHASAHRHPAGQLPGTAMSPDDFVWP
ncbi:hypothetical protein RVR_2115 [Actinacidiphila reveromycinica]|uniref:Secreted protein n=1 Tax=Actinacidiphila reveromycinica TaxID=659352 RepID=A0A7U3UQ72_9ACTN|nr:hypothetical protein [Streptomyces sp. SN-593]BBA96698.1 hypothetical protein RVR_2115 [Streptomyces sp. SN-593]